MTKIKNTHVKYFETLPSPEEMLSQRPLLESQRKIVLEGRKEGQDILAGKSSKKVAIIGPCSIHDPESALEYSRNLLKLKEKVSDKLLLIMRTYFEKPRSTVGWKGFVNDPHIDNSFKMEEGLKKSRDLLLQITGEGLLVGTEFLDPITPQFLGDLVSWVAIGARTTESQTHREMASGLSAPVGFKNGTTGNVDVAINAMKSANRPHHFLGIDSQGKVAVVFTFGNPFCHLILRGGNLGPNYEAFFVQKTLKTMKESGLNPALIVDCSHGNSNKDPQRQSEVLMDLVSQINSGTKGIKGFMMESHLKDGGQKFVLGGHFEYGVSITDNCLGWEKTEETILKGYESLN